MSRQRSRVFRAPDFAETGEYIIETAAGAKRIMRDTDPHVRWLLCEGGPLGTWIGHTKEEALRTLDRLFGAA